MIRIAASLIFLASAAQADVTVAFQEGAPKDRFVIAQTGDCPLGPLSVTINLEGSQGALIFDLASGGAGVEVFQPFDLVAGQALVSAAPTPVDGDRALTLGLSGLPAGETVAFTLDVDDTVGTREITVTGAEITGATVQIGDHTGTFGADAMAQVAVPCVAA